MNIFHIYYIYIEKEIGKRSFIYLCKTKAFIFIPKEISEKNVSLR